MAEDVVIVSQEGLRVALWGNPITRGFAGGQLALIIPGVSVRPEWKAWPECLEHFRVARRQQ